MFKRLLNLPLQNQDSLFLFGPRGAGKTQWLKTHLTQGYIYFDLLDPLTFRNLQAKPERF